MKGELSKHSRGYAQSRCTRDLSSAIYSSPGLAAQLLCSSTLQQTAKALRELEQRLACNISHCSWHSLVSYFISSLRRGTQHFRHLCSPDTSFSYTAVN